MLNFVISALVTLLVVVDPIGLAPTFIGITEGLSESLRRQVALRAALIAAAILVGSALIGNQLLAALGISLSAFRIARVITGWNGPVIFLQDLFVETAHRRRGIARALMARVAAYARDLGSPIVELTVRGDNNAAQAFYRRSGFQLLPQCLTYVLGGSPLTALAARDTEGQEQRNENAPVALAG